MEIIYLRGGGTSYFYKANVLVNPVVYDGQQHALPLLELNGPSHTFKVSKEAYVNSNGISYEGTASFSGLSVNGNIKAKEIKVETTNWPDYVFSEKHSLTSLEDLAKYLSKYKHLPEMPTADEVEFSGQNIGLINSILVKKVEELTLHLIKKNEEIQQLSNEVRLQRRDIKYIIKRFKLKKNTEL